MRGRSEDVSMPRPPEKSTLVLAVLIGVTAGCIVGGIMLYVMKP